MLLSYQFAILLDVVVVIVILLTLIFSTVTMQYITFPSDVIAVIIAFPAALAVNLPAASTVTTASLEDVHLLFRLKLLHNLVNM